jgi:hypothetical protein
MSAGLIPSIGSTYELATIRRPRLRRKRFQLQPMAPSNVISRHEPPSARIAYAGCDEPRISRSPDDGLLSLIRAISTRYFASMARNRNSFRAPRNHPMAARVWKHHLAKTAIGSVE